MAGFRRIMHASDFSRASGAAFAKAVELAKATGGELVLIHALTLVPPLVGGEFIPPRTWDQIEAAAHARVQKRLDRLAAKARRGRVRVRSFIVVGSPYEAIVRVARAKRADVLVIGTHGRTGLPRFLLGSVAQRVLATARLPVLMVHRR